MPRRLLPGGVRAQLALAIAALTALVVSLGFVAVYRVTGAQLRARIDEEIATQSAEWRELRAGLDVSTPAAVERVGRRFILAQGYHPAGLLFLVDVVDGPLVTSHPRTGGFAAAAARRLVRDLRGDRSGLSTLTVQGVGEMRVLKQPFGVHGRRTGTLYVADPLKPVTDAQADLLRTFALVGSLSMLLAVAAGVFIAGVLARPLRRMARVAAAVETGDLSVRAGETGARGEVGVLAGAFDRMLDRLERAFARQRDFVSDASHELRTPIAVLRAQVELLDRERDEDRRREATATLLRRLDEMDRLVGDLLTLAGAEAGRLVERRPVDVADFLEDVRRDLPLLGDRDFRVAALTGVVEADADRLTQVVRNLVRNAVAHTGPGDRVDVVATAQGEWLALAVTDTGSGIPPEHLEHVFERFYRADPSRSRDSGGSGLGLAIARAIVEAHDGRISARNAPGGGTTITVELPGYRPASDAGGGGRPALHGVAS